MTTHPQIINNRLARWKSFVEDRNEAARIADRLQVVREKLQAGGKVTRSSPSR